MTEQEWLTSEDFRSMLQFIRTRSTERKLRLYACACCRSIWHLLTDERSRTVVEVAERFADSEATEEEIADAADAADAAAYAANAAANAAAYAAYSTAVDAHAADVAVDVYAAANAADTAYAAANAADTAYADSCKQQASLLREIFGNPFVVKVIDFSWLILNGGTAKRLANAIYESKQWEELPILADALEDAGCADEDILTHLRSNVQHVRGCWVLDLLLAK